MYCLNILAGDFYDLFCALSIVFILSCFVLFPFAFLCFPCQAATVFSLSDSLSEITNP